MNQAGRHPDKSRSSRFVGPEFPPEEQPDSLEDFQKKNGSSGRIRTYNPPVNSRFDTGNRGKWSIASATKYALRGAEL